ncbi:MAG: chemotaxis-specific protein-glutamate methyltransferase CheB [Acidobacteriota bacterium]|nr:chemotaxis-specific protein-glutamate methyltransferase CheB [Acidobacteriota bacterium]
MSRPLRVLAADDSVVMRGIMAKLFRMHAEDAGTELPRMELCGVAQNGVECLELVRRLEPDVLVLDLEMPKLNGMEVLDRLRVEGPALPVIMCSSYTDHGARSTLEALARGASDYVTKPATQRDLASALLSLSQQLLPRIAALAKRERHPRETRGSAELQAGRRAAPVVAVPLPAAKSSGAVEIVVIGLSTGGPSALEQMLPNLPPTFPVPILIVQHMPKLFTRVLAERLDKCCALRVEQGYENAVIRPGTVWIAPGDAHMEVAPRRAMIAEGERALGARTGRVLLHQQEPLNHCRPSVDYLFFSAARMYGAAALALVMTGMGSDGLDGARAVRDCGGVVLAQDEASSAVWGMPGRVSEAGIANATLPLSAIAGALEQRVNQGRGSDSGVSGRGNAGAPVRREISYGVL